MEITSTVTFSNGVEIPRFGLGTYLIGSGDAARAVVEYALEVGYRHVDTARFYGNERGIGQAIRESSLLRADIFVTTKLWNSDHGYDQARRAFGESLRLLGLDYIDLYLIHWPVEGKRLDSWGALEAIYQEGKCRAIGVSNYLVRHLEELLARGNIPPVVNQIELHPYNHLYYQEVVDFCRAHDIVVKAYSPLTKGHRLNDPKLKRIADQYGKSTAQLLIRWSLQQDFVVIPKSSHQSHIRENADVFDFVISADDMAELATFNEDLIVSWDPTNAP